MNVQAKLGNALFDQLTKLRTQKGALSMEDVGALFEQLSATLHPPENSTETGFSDEIRKLAIFIEQTKNEIVNIAGIQETQDKEGATLHLDAVIKTTENATQTIMDAVDAIQATADKVGGECQKSVAESVTKIYEACNFQDLTGQRLSKVIKMIDEIDARINNLLKLSGKQVTSSGQGKLEIVKPAPGNSGHLLSGPQLPDAAPSQADIDALFASGKP